MRKQKSFIERAKRFLTSARGLILTIGALAAAVGSVLALIPKPPPDPIPAVLKANFSNLRVDRDVALSEYEARIGAHALASVGRSPSHPPYLPGSRYRLAADIVQPILRPIPRPTLRHIVTTTTTTETPTTVTSSEIDRTIVTTDGTTTTESGAPDSTVITSDGTIPEPPKPATRLASKTSFVEPSSSSSTPFRVVGNTQVKEGAGALASQQTAVVAALTSIPVTTAQLPGLEATNQASPTDQSVRIAVPDSCPKACAVTSMIDQSLAHHSDPIAAARALERALAESRGQIRDNKFYPLGVTVSYTVELAGFAHREAILEWSLWSKSTHRPLPKRWLREVIAMQIKPEADDESFVSRFWIPYPPPHGNYVVHLTLYDSKGVAHGEAETAPPFH